MDGRGIPVAVQVKVTAMCSLVTYDVLAVSAVGVTGGNSKNKQLIAGSHENPKPSSASFTSRDTGSHENTKPRLTSFTSCDARVHVVRIHFDHIPNHGRS